MGEIIQGVMEIDRHTKKTERIQRERETHISRDRDREREGKEIERTSEETSSSIN